LEVELETCLLNQFVRFANDALGSPYMILSFKALPEQLEQLEKIEFVK